MADLSRAFIALGTNLGDRRKFLRDALDAFDADDGSTSLQAVSPLYETAPVGGPEQGHYLNLVIEIRTSLEPLDLLDRCLEIERGAGRERLVRWGPRTLDADVLLIDDLQIDTERLTVPHPRMWDRRFVVEPLADIAPDLVSPHWRDMLANQAVGRVDPL